MQSQRGTEQRKKAISCIFFARIEGFGSCGMEFILIKDDGEGLGLSMIVVPEALVGDVWWVAN